jgi:hypothetical protein
VRNMASIIIREHLYFIIVLLLCRIFEVLRSTLSMQLLPEEPKSIMDFFFCLTQLFFFFFFLQVIEISFTLYVARFYG